MRKKKRDQCPAYMSGASKCVRGRSCTFLHDDIDGVYKGQRVLADIGSGTMRVRLHPTVEEEAQQREAGETSFGHEWKQMLLQLPILVQRPPTFKAKLCEHVLETKKDDTKKEDYRCPYGIACLNHHPDETGMTKRSSTVYILTRLMPRQRLCWSRVEEEDGVWKLDVIPDKLLEQWKKLVLASGGAIPDFNAVPAPLPPVLPRPLLPPPQYFARPQKPSLYRPQMPASPMVTTGDVSGLFFKIAPSTSRSSLPYHNGNLMLQYNPHLRNNNTPLPQPLYTVEAVRSRRLVTEQDGAAAALLAVSTVAMSDDVFCSSSPKKIISE
jgi:hypothetical protein